MSQLLNKIKSHPLNRAVLEFLKVDLKKNDLHFRNWSEARHPCDEGGIALFDNLGKLVPPECKYALSIHNVMVIPRDGEIFAFHTGRYSFFVKPDFEFFGYKNCNAAREGYTFDCIANIYALGDEWAFLDHFFEIEEAVLERAYSLRTAFSKPKKS